MSFTGNEFTRLGFAAHRGPVNSLLDGEVDDLAELFVHSCRECVQTRVVPVGRQQMRRDDDSSSLGAKGNVARHVHHRCRRDFEHLPGVSQIAELQQKLLKFCVAEIPVDEKIVTVFDGSLSGNLPREMMNQLLDKGAVICAVFAGTDEEGYRYVIGSRSEDVRSISKTLNSTLEGRGGGKPEMVQGSVKGTEDAVKEIIARYQ